MRRILLAVLGLVLVAALAFFTLAPGIVERSMNQVVAIPLKITPRARALHATLQIADMHADTLLWQRSLLDRSERGQIDLPRLLAGNYTLQVFSSVTKTPKGQNYDANPSDTDNITALAIADLQPPRTWGSLLQRSLWHAQKLDRYAAASNGQLRVIRSPADLDRLLADRAGGKKVVGGMLSIEGLQDLEGKLANLDVLYRAGFRMAGLAHFFDNEVAGSMHGEAKAGLTPLGRQVVRRMEALGMVVDVAHSSHATIAEVLAMAQRPVVASHGGVQATCKVNRNLTDDEIRGIARTGGVIGIGYWDAAICSTQPAAAAAAIAHVRDVAGIDHVGLGSDFDGAVTTGFDASQLAAVTQALIDHGFSDGDIAKVMGGNVLRVLKAGIAPSAAANRAV
ncbi:microsomal dipeptidase-like Zn-dependent dipeptidase [Sphingomonas sp. BE270]|jgi:membrane dipeptidase|uniref:dipeptidase n=1 Tax=unclassified Sphingomonas TaxID=196159 RepID=UPI00053EE428|nr:MULTISPECIES: dipeptidase [unclassified Sphingomonas]MDR6848502.1 microsomal dipeptidase-like Zn-dependent dipeptidase [Sphingomonas sp. BE137]MDR7260149.1 microsomal dipeptidase-like Zn-dependent dipeptidase [Sphingomonas sp. BE270]